MKISENYVGLSLKIGLCTINVNYGFSSWVGCAVIAACDVNSEMALARGGVVDSAMLV